MKSLPPGFLRCRTHLVIWLHQHRLLSKHSIRSPRMLTTSPRKFVNWRSSCVKTYRLPKIVSGMRKTRLVRWLLIFYEV